MAMTTQENKDEGVRCRTSVRLNKHENKTEHKIIRFLLKSAMFSCLAVILIEQKLMVQPIRPVQSEIGFEYDVEERGWVVVEVFMARGDDS